MFACDFSDFNTTHITSLFFWISSKHFVLQMSIQNIDNGNIIYMHNLGYILFDTWIQIKVFIGSRSTLLIYLDNYGYKYVSKLKWTQYAEAQLNVTLLYISKCYVNFVLLVNHHSMHIIIANTLCLKISAAWSMAGRSQFTTRPPGRRVW